MRSCTAPHGMPSSSNGRGDPSASSIESRIPGAPSTHTTIPTGAVGGGSLTISTVPLKRQLQSPAGGGGSGGGAPGISVTTTGVPGIGDTGSLMVFVEVDAVTLP